MSLGAKIRQWLAVVILAGLALPAAGATAPDADSVAVRLLCYADATGNPVRAREIADFLAPGFPEEGRILLTKVGKALAGEGWQKVLPQVEKRVVALGGEPFALPPEPADETRFANVFLGWLDLRKVDTAQAQLAPARKVFPQDSRLTRIATQLEAIAVSEAKRLNLEQQGKFLVATYMEKLEDLQETKLPKNFYEERAFQKLPATEREAILQEEATLKKNLQQGHDILAQAKGITPETTQLAALRTEVAAMLSAPAVSGGTPAPVPKSAETARP